MQRFLVTSFGLLMAVAANAQQILPTDVEGCARKSGKFADIANCVTALANQIGSTCEARISDALREQSKSASSESQKLCAKAIDDATRFERERARVEHEKALAAATANLTKSGDEASRLREQAAVKRALDQARVDNEAALQQERDKAKNAASSAARDERARVQAKRGGAGVKAQTFLKALEGEVSADNPVLRSSFDPYSGLLLVEQKKNSPVAIPLAAIRSVSVHTDTSGETYLAFLCSGPSNTECVKYIPNSRTFTSLEHAAAISVASRPAGEKLIPLLQAVIDSYENR